MALPPSTTMLFKFACYFPAKNPCFIVINIESDSWARELLIAIEVQLHKANVQVELDNLRLFKVNLFLSENSQLTHMAD